MAAAQSPLKLTADSPLLPLRSARYGKMCAASSASISFDKVEMVQIVRPEQSYDALEEMVGHAEIFEPSSNCPIA